MAERQLGNFLSKGSVSHAMKSQILQTEFAFNEKTFMKCSTPVVKRVFAALSLAAQQRLYHVIN
jgi:hypothetical protein